MSDILKDDPVQRARWLAEAKRAAHHMKHRADIPPRDPVVFAFVFNDAVVKVPVYQETLRVLNEIELAQYLYDSVVSAVSTKH